MGERSNYTPGTFSWADLTTSDQGAAKAFYGSLFDWHLEDFPVQEGVVYTIASLDGKRVAAISPQPQQQRDAGAPPTWNSYITVESADSALDRARELGGNVHAGPYDVFTAGRMGVVQDPQGAFFAVWKPGENIGAELVNGHGMLSWNELTTPDLEGATSFYSGLFGWRVSDMEGMPMPYRTIQTTAGQGNGGMTVPQQSGAAAHWLVYFGSENIEVTAEKIGTLGGTLLVEATDIGVGQIAIARDPQGAVFALYAGRFDD